MEEFKKELYNAALITAGATAVGFAAKKAIGTQLGTPETLKGSLKLGAMSRQAKEKKAASQKADIEDEFQIPSIDSVNPLAVVGVVGVVGVVVYYKYFRSSREDVVVDRSEKSETQKPVEQEKPKQRELDSLD